MKIPLDRFFDDLPWCAGALLAGGLFYASFPPLEWAWAGWLTPVPLLIIAAFNNGRAAARWGWLAGLAGWLPSLFWLTKVTWAGWLALSAYCALYTLFFVCLTARCWQRWDVAAGRCFFRPVFFPAACWAMLEFLRSGLFTGFPWNQLAVSQYARPGLLQPAAWGGVYAVSFMMVLPAAMLTLVWVQAARMQWWKPMLTGLLLLVVPVAARHVSAARLQADNARGVDAKVALIQLNVPQLMKWSDTWTDATYARLEQVSLAVLRGCRPDLLVWPETVLPDFFRSSMTARDVLTRLMDFEVPIVAGSMDFSIDDGRMIYYNTSFMLTPHSGLEHAYHKRHLVMFGEYVPLARWLPFVNALTPVTESFTPGQAAVVFDAGGGMQLAPLICFEDTLPGLSRRSVRAGGRLLVNQTNDAWFDFSAAARQHMAHCVFRSVENRVPAVRATNTGITCFIDAWGNLRAELPPAKRHPAAVGSLCRIVRIPPADMPPTFYTRFGDIFAWLCLLAVLAAFLPSCIVFKKGD